MSILHQVEAATPHAVPNTALADREGRGQWWRFLLITVIAIIMIIPVLVTVILSFRPGNTSTASGFTFENFTYVFTSTDTLKWLRNSLFVTVSTVIVSVVVAAPAGSLKRWSRVVWGTVMGVVIGLLSSGSPQNLPSKTEQRRPDHRSGPELRVLAGTGQGRRATAPTIIEVWSAGAAGGGCTPQAAQSTMPGGARSSPSNRAEMSTHVWG